MADPMAVKVVVVGKGSVLIEVGKDGVRLPLFLCRRRELPQNTAKRVLKEVFGLETNRVESLPIISRIAVESIPEEVRSTWPKGAKTIPCISFAYRVENVASVKKMMAFEWMERQNWQRLPDSADRMVLDSLS
ncbi:MAG: hypothetical protein KBS81_04380 [Spirochaetales bacterium]|nr:hypothetical protein [Candidatus Physcosoma equi]